MSEQQATVRVDACTSTCVQVSNWYVVASRYLCTHLRGLQRKLGKATDQIPERSRQPSLGHPVHARGQYGKAAVRHEPRQAR